MQDFLSLNRVAWLLSCFSVENSTTKFDCSCNVQSSEFLLKTSGLSVALASSSDLTASDCSSLSTCHWYHIHITWIPSLAIFTTMSLQHTAYRNRFPARDVVAVSNVSVSDFKKNWRSRPWELNVLVLDLVRELSVNPTNTDKYKMLQLISTVSTLVIITCRITSQLITRPEKPTNQPTTELAHSEWYKSCLLMPLTCYLFNGKHFHFCVTGIPAYLCMQHCLWLF